LWKIASEVRFSLGPVARIAKTKGLNRLSALDPSIANIRYEMKQPGEIIHIDFKRLGRSQGIGTDNGVSFRSHRSAKALQAARDRQLGAIGQRHPRLTMTFRSSLNFWVNRRPVICSSLYLILQSVPFWRWPVSC